MNICLTYQDECEIASNPILELLGPAITINGFLFSKKVEPNRIKLILHLDLILKASVLPYVIFQQYGQFALASMLMPSQSILKLKHCFLL